MKKARFQRYLGDRSSPCKSGLIDYRSGNPIYKLCSNTDGDLGSCVTGTWNARIFMHDGLHVSGVQESC